MTATVQGRRKGGRQSVGPAASKDDSQKISSLYICHWSLGDPLCQTQTLAYLRKLTALGHRFALITFEQPRYRQTVGEIERTRRLLTVDGIFWYPLRYHGRFTLAAKIYECLRGIGTGLVITWRHAPDIVHTRGTTPVGIAVVLKALTKLKFLYDTDSSLAEEYADTGYWSRGSLLFKLTEASERVARRRADAVVVLTERMRRRFIDDHGVCVPVEVIPCCVDTDRMRFDPAARLQRRRELNVGDDAPLFVYVGKAGWRYQVEPMFEFLRVARAKLGPVKLLVLTPDRPSCFTDPAKRCGVAATDLYVVRSPPDEVAGWLSAADAGLAFIRSLPCETGSAPVKVAEYLSVGLPVLITPLIGDYSQLIDEEQLGVVVRSFDEADLGRAAADIGRLIQSGDDVRQRCRSVAETRLSVVAVGTPRYASTYQRLGCTGVRSPHRAPSARDEMTNEVAG